MSTQCCVRVHSADSFSGHRCCIAPKFEQDGKAYCSIHYPPNVKAKQAARSAAWNAKWDASEAARQKRESDAAEQKRRADLYPELLAACQVAFDQTCAVGRPKDWEQIRAAIAKATGAA